jgi:hypothetical protein
MDDNVLAMHHGAELLLVRNCKQHLDFLAENQWFREYIEVPNGTRKVFCTDGAYLKELNELRSEVGRLLYEIENDLTRSFRKLAEAGIAYH